MDSKAVEILGDYSAWTDAHGLVQPGPLQEDGTIGTSQNGLLYSAQYAYLLWKNKIYVEDDRLVKVFHSCEISPGLYKRDPSESAEWTSVDDYTGVALMSFCFESTLARDVLAYGKKTGGLFGIGYKYWLYRFPALFGALRIAAGGDATWFQKLWFVGCLLFSDRQQDSLSLTCWLTKIYEARAGVVMRWAIKWRRRVFKKTYPGGFGELFGQYSQNMQHPHVKHLWGEI